MRKALIVLSLLCMLLPIKAAERSLTFDTRGLTLGIISGEYEQKLAEKITVSGQVLNWRYREEELALTAQAYALGVRRYFFGRAFDGFYGGLYGATTKIHENKPFDNELSAYGFALSLGLKVKSASGLCLDLGISQGITLKTNPPSEISFTEQAVGTGLSIAMGYAW